MPEISVSQKSKVQCYHCGEDCDEKTIVAHKKHFCCDGCKMVFEILNKTDVCIIILLVIIPELISA
jgi:Cu+-exporting ATPase